MTNSTHAEHLQPAGCLRHGTSRVAANIKVTDIEHLSDHCLITADVVGRVPKPIILCRSRNIRAVDAAMFENELRRSSLFTQPADTVDAYVTQLHDVLAQLLDRVAPARTRRRRSQKPVSRWLSAEAVNADAKRGRRRLERRWKATGAETDRLNYRRACRKANQLINASRSDHYRPSASMKQGPILGNVGRSSANCCTPRTPTKPELMTKTGISVSHLESTLWTRLLTCATLLVIRCVRCLHLLTLICHSPSSWPRA